MKKCRSLKIVIPLLLLQLCGLVQADARYNAQTPRTKSSANDLGLFLVLVLKNACDAHIPGFKAKATSGWNRVRSRYSLELERLEQDDNVRKALEDGAQRPPEPVDRRELEEKCIDLAERLNRIGMPPDPKFSSPESTWSAWLAALRTADRKGALACLSGSAKSKYRTVLHQLSDEDLIAMANSVSHIAPSTSVGQFREFFVTRKDGKAGTVYFVDTGGQWLIDEM